MDGSILDTVKKLVNIAPEDSSFDTDLILGINSVLSKLTQIGVGPEEGFEISDSTTLWSDYLNGDKRLNLVKNYVALCVRMVFDPPSTSFVIQSMERQIQELEFRISVVREHDSYVDPNVVADSSVV